MSCTIGERLRLCQGASEILPRACVTSKMQLITYSKTVPDLEETSQSLEPHGTEEEFKAFGTRTAADMQGRSERGTTWLRRYPGVATTAALADPVAYKLVAVGERVG